MNHGFIAGGYVRDAMLGLRYNDVDIFFDSPEAVREFKQILWDDKKNAYYGNGNFEEGPNSLSVDLYANPTVPFSWQIYMDKYFPNPGRHETIVQFIVNEGLCGSIEEVLSNFDNNLNMVAYSLSSRELIISEDDFPLYLMSSSLVLNPGFMNTDPTSPKTSVRCAINLEGIARRQGIGSKKRFETFLPRDPWEDENDPQVPIATSMVSSDIADTKTENIDNLAFLANTVMRSKNLMEHCSDSKSFDVCLDSSGLKDLLTLMTEYAYLVGKSGQDLDIIDIQRAFRKNDGY